MKKKKKKTRVKSFPLNKLIQVDLNQSDKKTFKIPNLLDKK